MVPWGARYHYFGSSRDMLLTDFSEQPVVGLVMVSDSDSENGWLWKHEPLVLNGLITNEEMMVHLEGSWLFPTLKTSATWSFSEHLEKLTTERM